MKNSYRSRWAAGLAGLILLVPLVGSAQDHVVPPADEKKMVNAGIKVMPRPKAWDDINKPLTASVTAANPLEVTICTSYRSPFAYLGMDRYAALEQDYNAKVDVKYVFPIAIRDPSFFEKASDYRYLYDPMDMERIAKRRGIPYHVDFSGKTWRDPIVVGGNLVEIAPKEDQIYIYPLYAVSTLMQTEHPDKNLAFAQRMFRKIYDGTASMTWPDEMDDVLDELGLDGKAIVKKAKQNEDKYIAIVDKNQEWCHASGHGGVPNAVFRGEPFWGQDRIEALVWRMKQNGLTYRERPPAQ
jgi:2-hydroxychromene-2-carboxylate isomerase